ncbi:TonB-dependent receptor domain-containing protein [Actibacterium ureilyticum]|uniref:TonB-dependent receptor domain-containing protein n=1 Tax=Actibacterium ureilyticum TaxID=1590614 RepID=UPI000BAAEC10|nr:TonB-dependent receptor [Actibacterium ureilyticum]
MTLTTKTRLLMAVSCLTVTAAQAQEAAPVDLGTIRIEAADAQALLGNDTVTEDEIEQRNPNSVADVFVGESSVTVSGGAAIAQKVIVNGIEESQLSVTIDGARQNKGAFHHTGNVLIDPALLKKVEISKGLAPADAGPGALAGAIAYETKDAGDLLEPGDDFGGQLTLGTDTNAGGLRSTLSIFGRQGGFEYVLSGTRHDSDDYEDGDGTTIQGTGADLTDYIAKLAYESPTGHRFSFASSKTEDTGERIGQTRGGLTFIRPDFASVVGLDSELVEALARRTSHTLSYRNTRPEGWFAPEVQLTWNEQKVDVIGSVGTNTSFSGTFKNEFQLGNGTLTAGLDFFRDTAESDASTGDSGKETHKNVGLFAQARQDLSDRVSVSYGARYDVQDFEGADGSDFDDSGVSVNGAVDVILTDTLTFNAGIASSWGGYELGEAALVNFRTPWSYDGFGTARARAGRVGLRFDNGTWQASGAVFRTEVDNIHNVFGSDRSETQNLVSRGYEASLGYRTDRGFARLNYTYADVDLDDETITTTSYYLGRPIGHLFALETGWDMQNGWMVGGSAELALDNDDTEIELDGYEVFNAYVSYTPPSMENLEVRFDVRNIFDETYAKRSSDGLDATNVVALTEPGRTFALTAKIRF